MKNILSFILTSIFHCYFGLVLLLFHPVQMGALWFFGDKARKKSVDFMNICLVKGLYILGCKVKFSGFDHLPENRPVIIISNHQSMYDISPVVVGFKKYYPKFISKKELSKNLPSISINLKYGKSAIIDRENGSQAVREIIKLGQLIEKYNYAACIFPEGTRSKTGELKKFMPAGINTLLRAAPSAIIIPFVIDGHSKLLANGYFPLNIGQRITYTALQPIEPAGKSIDEIVNLVENVIKESLIRAIP